MVGRPIHIEIIGLDVIERNFDDAAKMMIETLREFKHYDDDYYAHEIQIEIVSGETRISIQRKSLKQDTARLSRDFSRDTSANTLIQ